MKTINFSPRYSIFHFIDKLSFRISGGYSIVRKNRDGHLNCNNRILKGPQTKQKTRFFISIAILWLKLRYCVTKVGAPKSLIFSKMTLPYLTKRSQNAIWNEKDRFAEVSETSSQYFPIFVFENRPISDLCCL